MKKVKGRNWEIGGSTNAWWTRARLADVFAHAPGSDVGMDAQGAHFCFNALDCDSVTDHTYAASVLDMISRHPDAVLAYGMNYDTLPHDHNYPVRVVMPCVMSASDVNWTWPHAPKLAFVLDNTVYVHIVYISCKAMPRDADETIRFQASRWLRIVSTARQDNGQRLRESLWYTLRSCWINAYHEFCRRHNTWCWQKL